MLSPKRTKFRKLQKGRIKGPALRGAQIAFGDIGLKAMEHGKLTNQQIEAARIAMMRHIKRGGKVWIRVFPDRPVTAKPLETRQGSGKGAPVGWCAPVKPGRVLYEIKGVSLDLAREALTRAAHKLPVKTIIVVREGIYMAAKKKTETAARPAAQDLRSMSVEQLRTALTEQRQELMNARFKHAAAQLEKTSELKVMRKQVARIETVLNEKEQRA